MEPNQFFEAVEARFYDWNYRHPSLLYSLMRCLKPQVALEIGSYRAYCACYMARALQENGSGHLYCIDNFTMVDHQWRHGDPEAHWEENTRALGVRDTITLLKGRSKDVQWPEKVDFAYIDGWHSYETCRHDAEQCMDRGAFCFAVDDVRTCVGPRQYFSELRENPAWDTLYLPSDNGLGIAFRSRPLPRVEYIQELDGELGSDLHALSDEEMLTELARVSMLTGKRYEGMLAGQ